MKIGYARISTDTQKNDVQIEALSAAGCQKIFTEIASGAKKDRTALAEALAYLRPNSDDKLVVYKLDRVARSLPHLIEIMERLNKDPWGETALPRYGRNLCLRKGPRDRENPSWVKGSKSQGTNRWTPTAYDRR